MVKENWSLTKEQDNNIETEIIKQTNKTNSSHNDVGSVQNPIQDSTTTTTTTNVWGEYVSKSNLIDLHFC